MSAPDHYEVAPYPIGRFRNGHFTGTRRVECASGDVASLLAWFDSYPNDHWPYPFGGWSNTAVLTAAEVKPKANSKVTSSTKPLIDYERAWIDLTYTTEGMVYIGGLYVWETLRAGASNMPIPKPADLRWGDGTPLLPGEQIAKKVLASSTYQITFYKLASTPTAILWLQDGCTNASAYITATQGLLFPAETMLCVGAELKRGSPGSATNLWKQCTYTFHINPYGWNNVWRAETNTWEAVYLPTGDRFLPQPPLSFQYINLA